MLDFKIYKLNYRIAQASDFLIFPDFSFTDSGYVMRTVTAAGPGMHYHSYSVAFLSNFKYSEDKYLFRIKCYITLEKNYIIHTYPMLFQCSNLCHAEEPMP